MNDTYARSAPTSLRAGDSWRWAATYSDFDPNQGWRLKLVLSSATNRFAFPDAGITLLSSGFTVAIAAADTARVAPGEYDLYPIFTNGDQTQTLEPTILRVLPNIVGSDQPIDTRSFAKRTLDALEAALGGDMSSGVQEYSIHGRSVRFMERTELLAMRAQFQGEYNRERGISAPNRIELSF